MRMIDRPKKQVRAESIPSLEVTEKDILALALTLTHASNGPAFRTELPGLLETYTLNTLIRFRKILFTIVERGDFPRQPFIQAAWEQLSKISSPRNADSTTLVATLVSGLLGGVATGPYAAVIIGLLVAISARKAMGGIQKTTVFKEAALSALSLMSLVDLVIFKKRRDVARREHP